MKMHSDTYVAGSTETHDHIEVEVAHIRLKAAVKRVPMFAWFNSSTAQLSLAANHN